MPDEDMSSLAELADARASVAEAMLRNAWQAHDDLLHENLRFRRALKSIRDNKNADRVSRAVADIALAGPHREESDQ